MTATAKAESQTLRRPSPTHTSTTFSTRSLKAVAASAVAAATKPKTVGIPLASQKSQSLDVYLRQIRTAAPLQLVEMERQGVSGTFIIDLSKRMDLPSSRVFAILRIPKATAARKTVAGAMVDGRAGQAAIGMAKLLGMAQDMVSNSTAPEAKDFDAVKWLGQWIERPQPALDGRKPSDLLDTPTGMGIVMQLLGSLQSGAYQ